MKSAVFLSIIFTLFGSLASAQSEPQKYAYNIFGKVLNAKSRPMPKTIVCFIPAVRPINGRIPCAETDNNGIFDFVIKDIPDKYKVCASTSDLIFAPAGDNKTRMICTETMLFGSQDKSRKVLLKFKPKDK